MLFRHRSSFDALIAKVDSPSCVPISFSLFYFCSSLATTVIMPNNKKTKSRSKGKPGKQSPASNRNTKTPPPRAEPHRPSDLFTSVAFSGVLEQVILELPLASISSVARVCCSLPL